jgi:hypothetical protein
MTMINGNNPGQSKPDMTFPSCTDRLRVPAPHNSPVRRNSRQSVIASSMLRPRFRGGGPSSKRTAASPRGMFSKKKKISGGKGRARKSKDDVFDDSEALLANGNSPLYDDSNIAVSFTSQSRKISLILFIGNPSTPFGAEYSSRHCSWKSTSSSFARRTQKNRH